MGLRDGMNVSSAMPCTLLAAVARQAADTPLPRLHWSIGPRRPSLLALVVWAWTGAAAAGGRAVANGPLRTCKGRPAGHDSGL